MIPLFLLGQFSLGRGMEKIYGFTPYFPPLFIAGLLIDLGTVTFTETVLFS